MEVNEAAMFYAANQKEWRRWLKKNHSSKQHVWLISHKKISSLPSVSWTDAVDEALCYGWIDGIAKPLDENRFLRFFCKRKPQSNWSKINKNKVVRLTEEGLMAAAGQRSVDIAKENGSWTILDDVEELKIPKDLEKAFKLHRGSKKFFLSISKSGQKMLLQWVVLAKTAPTREKRIKEIAAQAGLGLKPKSFR